MSEDEVQLEILKRMMEVLRRLRGGDTMSVQGELDQLQTRYKGTAARQAAVYQISTPIKRAPTGWTRTTVKSEFFAEMENTCYQAQGTVKTADGRELNFGVSLEMSRAFCAKYESITQEEYICTDPLVINLDGNVGSVSDQKFLFDLDSDGEEELISFAGRGSGFLALDKNGDGVINDGSELFGTSSGNGFADLAEYDEDGNGWIDENDSVFEKLKVWTKDEQGNNKLISIAEAGVGAIYLGYAGTEFSLNEAETNHTNGIIRSTGIYLYPRISQAAGNMLPQAAGKPSCVPYISGFMFPASVLRKLPGCALFFPFQGPSVFLSLAARFPAFPLPCIHPFYYMERLKK